MKFNWTPERKNQFISAVVAFVVAVVTLIGAGLSAAPAAVPAGAFEQAKPEGIVTQSVPYNVSALPMRCKNSGIDCITIWNGSDIRVFSDGGTTQKFSVDGATGAVTAVTLTVRSLISQTVGFNSTGASTIATTTVGSAGVGPLTVHAPATFTDTVTFKAASIADAALSSNVPLKNEANTFTLAQTFSANPILPGESITPTAGATITFTAYVVTLTPTQAVTVTLGACTTNTQVVVYNSANFDVIISDTGNFIGAGAQTLGQYDALPATCIATKWVQTGPVSAN